MSIVLFVEGYTEKALPDFFKKYLDDKLPNPIGIKVVRFNGEAAFLKNIVKKIQWYEKNKRYDKDLFVGLIDLYPLKIKEKAKNIKSLVETRTRQIENEVNCDRFKMFFAVHETEAYILAQPELLPTAVANALTGRPPEEVNFNTPPKKLLKKLYKKSKKDYKEKVDSVNLIKELDPDTVRKKCPYFKGMLDTIYTLVK